MLYFKRLFVLAFWLTTVTMGVSAAAFQAGHWMPRSQWLPVSMGGRYGTDVFLFDVQSRVLVNLTKDPFSDELPSISPDERLLLFSSHRQRSYEIYIMDLQTFETGRLTLNFVGDNFPSWSPDSKSLAFVSGDQNTDVYTMNLDDLLPRRLTYEADADLAPNWSPDGQWIAYVNGSGEDPASIVIQSSGCVQTCEKPVIPFTGHPGYDFFPSWSPDGSQIAYLSDSGGMRGIYTRSTDCLQQQSDCLREPARLLAIQDRMSDNINLSTLFWSADGTQILFTGMQNGLTEIYAVDANCDDPSNGCPAEPLTHIDRSFLRWRLERS